MRLGHLDTLRGLAALAVVLQHAAPFWSGGTSFIAAASQIYIVVFQWTFWANGGLHPGVVVFIVLSGFCIHMSAARRPRIFEQPAFWKSYALRRMLRIGPVFMFGCVLGIVAMKFAQQPPLTANQYVPYLVSSLLFNAFYPIGGGPPGNEILQTVIVEMWLYITYPLLLFIWRRFGTATLLLIALAFHLVVPIVLLGGVDPVWAQRSWYAFLLYWILGASSAEYYFRYKKTNKPGALGIVALFLIYIVLGHLVQFKGAHLPKSLLLALWTAILLSVIEPKRSGEKDKKSLLSTATEKLGQESYTLYAVHLPLIAIWTAVAASFTFPYHSLAADVGLLGIIGLGTHLCFRLVERPSHEFARRMRQQ